MRGMTRCHAMGATCCWGLPLIPPQTARPRAAAATAAAAAAPSAVLHGPRSSGGRSLPSTLWGAPRRSPTSCRSTTGPATEAAASTTPPGPSPSPGSSLEGRLIPGLRLGSLPMLEQRLRIAGHTFTLVMPSDVDAVIDLYLDAAGLNDGDPYWTRVWPSSIALAACILERPELVRGKKVADVGCGLGLAGLAAAMAGAREVVLLDREPLALHCALLSAAASGVLPAGSGGDGGELLALEPAPLHAPGSGTVGSSSPQEGAARREGSLRNYRISHADLQQHYPALLQHLRPDRSDTQASNSTNDSKNGSSSSRSGTAGSEGGGAPGRARGAVRARTFDWAQAELLQEQFDVLLACDVLYEDSAVQPIAELVPRLLSPRDSSRLLLADPPTRTAHNRERFLRLLQEQQQLASVGKGALRLMLEECSLQTCRAEQLDNEMVGGVAAQTIPVQLMLLRHSLGGDTVGLKALGDE